MNYICVDDVGYEGRLTKGKVYARYNWSEEYGEDMMTVEFDDGTDGDVMAERFEEDRSNVESFKLDPLTSIVAATLRDNTSGGVKSFQEQLLHNICVATGIPAETLNNMPIDSEKLVELAHDKDMAKGLQNRLQAVVNGMINQEDFLHGYMTRFYKEKPANEAKKNMEFLVNLVRQGLITADDAGKVNRGEMLISDAMANNSSCTSPAIDLTALVD